MKKTLFVCAVAGTMALGTSQAETITIGASKDNTLYESATGNLSNGAGVNIVSGRTSEEAEYLRRGLIAFNVAGAAPAGSTVTNVTLTLEMVRTASTSQDHSLHRLTADWGEGASDSSSGGIGATATTGDATWLHRFFSSSNWTTPGGDYSPTPSATQSVGTNGPYTWTGAQLVADVQSMLDTPASNFGWIIIGNETEARTTKSFASREDPIASNRPSLTITFTTATSPPPVHGWSLY